MHDSYRALVAEQLDDNLQFSIQELQPTPLGEGEVWIKGAYSSLNYKDALACTPHARVAASYPLIPGIDLSGVVVSSKDSRYQEGDPVIVTGYELGVAHSGGFSEYVKVPADWIVPLPDGLSLQEAMILGTAGLTAALSLYELLKHGLTPDQGPVIVTGATGGVGSIAVSLLSKLRFACTASTGKLEQSNFLTKLGASEIIGRSLMTDQPKKALRKEAWAAAIDPVGGKTLSYLLSSMQYGGAVALSGLTAGSSLETTVYPFILRSVKLLGIDSVYCPHVLRQQLWERLGSDWKIDLTQLIDHKISLEQIPEHLQSLTKGQAKGRIIVQLSEV